jgi:hypothetical protein
MMVADFALITPAGATAVIVEVKGRAAASLEWAARLRRNYLAHGRWPFTAAFMLVTLDALYYWESRPELRVLEEPPDLVLSWREARGAVRTDESRHHGDRSFHSELEAEVWSWLNRLIDPGEAIGVEASAHATLRSLPSLRAAIGGRIQAEPEL